MKANILLQQCLQKLKKLNVLVLHPQKSCSFHENNPKNSNFTSMSNAELKKTVPDKAAKIFKDVGCKFRFDVIVLQNHEKNVDERKKTLRDLKRIIKERADENAALTKELEELNVSVNERRHIHEVNGKTTINLVTLHSFHGH